MASDLIGFTAGLLITVLLLVLTLRAARLPGTPLANIVFAVCALLWSAGGLGHAAFLAVGMTVPARISLAIQFSGAGAFPIPILAIWRPFAVSASQKSAARILQISACASAALLAALLWLSLATASVDIPFSTLEHFAAFNAAVFLILGAAFSLRPASTPRAVFLPSLAIVAAVSGAALAMSMAHHSSPQSILRHLFAALGSHLVLLIVLCAFLLFARFRFADVFIRYAVRILLAGVWAVVLAFATQSPVVNHLAMRSSSPWAMHVLSVILMASGLLLSFTFVDDGLSRLVSRWLFRAADYRTARRQFSAKLAGLQLESDIVSAVEEAARVPLELGGARLVTIDSLPAAKWPPGILEGEVVEFAFSDDRRDGLPFPAAEVLIPIMSSGHVTHVLLIAPGPARPGLVTHDLDYLRAIAAQCGNRLDALHRQREAVERQSREALLLQQVTEAELRALRAQINPHFLFNSLNTIADLIIRDPRAAEAMTLRLAAVFRHVLAQRPLISVRDEIEFLRTYLHIEEARFGDRLHVEIDLAPEAAGEEIPSLILQPLVENALKHGLGPKPGPGRLWISARCVGDWIRLTVEDDGMGPNGRAGAQGLGLTNVAERLRTLYEDRASITMESRNGGGSIVTVLIPRGKAMDAS